MALPNSPTAAISSMLSSPMGSVPSNESSASPNMNWEPIRARLLAPDLKEALNAAIELREGIEIVHTVEYPLMLSALLPAFSTILGHRTTPIPDPSSVQHKLRNVVLEIISRMPSNEILRPHAPHLVAISLDILNRDYEENAMLASRIIFDLYKVYRSLPQDYIQPYLDFVQSSYRLLPASVQNNFSFTNLAVVAGGEAKQQSSNVSTSVPEFSNDGKSQGDQKQEEGKKEAPPASPGPVPAAAPAPTPPSTGAGSSSSPSMPKIPATPTPRQSPKSNTSFRVLTECPLVVMLMFQLYPKFLRTNVPGLISVMMEALALRAPSISSITQGGQQLDASAQRLYFSRCRELVAAQAKTLSFLTYLLRGFSNELKPHEARLASNVVALMSTCPREFISTRKELLVATRHLLNSDFRDGFFRHVDALLDERVLMGSHHRYSEQTVLRPLGYTTLSDLVHHVRSKLNLNQISKVISIFSRVLHDSSMTLPMSTQYTAVRTLLSVSDMIFNNKDRDPQIGRDLLVRIFHTLVDKLDALHTCRTKVENKNFSEDGQGSGSKQETDEMSMIAHLELPVGCDPKDSLRDLKSMVRAIIVGNKTLIWHINKYRLNWDKEKADPLKPGTNEEVASALLKITHTEQSLIDRYIQLAFPCMKWLKEDAPLDSTPPVVDHYRDALSYFAASFSVFDAHDLKRTFGRRIEELVEALIIDSTVLVVPRHLLAANATTSFEACSLLLNFLVQRLDFLAVRTDNRIHFLPPAEEDKMNDFERVQSFQPCTLSKEELIRRSSAHLQLFERLLKSLATFPENERALRPHLRHIVSKCLQASMEKQDCEMDSYGMLLRYIFRSISAGKFEDAYRELLPLIPTVLNGLFRIFRSADDPVLHHTIIELLLTIPARLSSLLPHMNLLLQVIICALESNSGDLVNLGLRTLEFWVDNLNPEFLFPEISKRSELFVSLMKGLSMHLRPAPYPYGLLTLRLLGKLGGKNRHVLRQPMNIQDDDEFEAIASELKIECNWLVSKPPTDANEQRPDEATKTEFALTLPISRCVKIIKGLVNISTFAKQNQPLMTQHDGRTSLKWSENDSLWKIHIEDTDFLPYCLAVMQSTQQSQASSSLRLLMTALSEIIGIEETVMGSIAESGGSSLPGDEDARVEGSRRSQPFRTTNTTNSCIDADFEHLCYGIFLCGAIDSINDEAIKLSKGLLSNMFRLVGSYQHCFVRVDANGSEVKTEGGGEEGGCNNAKEKEGDPLEVLPGSLKPFGYFKRRGIVADAVNPLFVSKALARVLSDPSARVQSIGLELLRHILSKSSTTSDLSTMDKGGDKLMKMEWGCLVFFESLLSYLCAQCLSSKWDKRQGLYVGICEVLQTLGHSWSRKYELEVMNVALFSLKGIPKEMALAGLEAFNFMVEICLALYGKPSSFDKEVIIDPLASDVNRKDDDDNSDTLGDRDASSKNIVNESNDTGGSTSNVVSNDKSTPGLEDKEGSIKDSRGTQPGAESVERPQQCPKESTGPQSSRMELDETESDGKVPTSACQQVLPSPCDEVMHLLITEMASTQHILRFACRYVLKNYVFDTSTKVHCVDRLMRHMAVVKRVLFSRSLRLLPLPEQVGAVEGLAMFVDQLPDLIPLNDQHLLAFLSELLKMTSVADGEMTDTNLVGNVVDKNGYAVASHESTVVSKDLKQTDQMASAIFLRRDSVTKIGGASFFIPMELPNGVQLRVSAIILLRSVIRGHANPFFDAESTTPIGNIRPHVISLLFRSLVSVPLHCVNAAHDALRDVLNLSVVTEDGKSKSRLRKELLQTCIRPVLLNLRDYTRLTVQLLRGLSRLLSLLSSWFNKTLGEKLLDHLQKWTDPTRIKMQRIWREGEEPRVASAIIDLFALLPHASQFVEPLVKTTIKLEACLPVYQSRCTTSPYREPLARYLSKHCQYAVSFFLQRLKTPLYNELFQDIIAYPSSKPLRVYLRGKQSSMSLLNICFERPLAIIRSEKAASSTPPPGSASPKSSTTNTNEMYNLHGIHPFIVSPNQNEATLKEDVDGKRKKLQLLQQQLNRAKEVLQEKTSRTGPNTPSPSEMEEAKRKHRVAKIAHDRGTKEFNESRQKYAAEVAQIKQSRPEAAPDSSGTRPMTMEAMELQQQGFRLVNTLIADNFDYFKDHNDVLRAFRWLWRSKGRHLRLQNEHGVPPRYHEESKVLARILVNCSESNRQDVDLLFELIRIFLHPSSNDFSFVRSSLAAAVKGLSTEDKMQVMNRFFALLSGESSEEIKTLSIQLVVYPMLYASFHDGTRSEFIDSSMAKCFVKEVLFHDGKAANCGDRLKVELLKMTNILLEFIPGEFQEFAKDIVDFCSSFLKSEDALCTSWAYLVLCRHVCTMKASSKLILQIYGALILSHQPEGKEIIRSALDLLIPAMTKQLCKADWEKAIDFTNRIMFEEVNSIPQLAHIWRTAVSHADSYYINRHQLVRYMINSLTRLGLPPNTPSDNRSLSVSVVELILSWHHKQIAEGGKKNEGIDSEDDSLLEKRPNSPSTRKFKTDEFDAPHPPVLDQKMVDTLVNFVVRLKILLGDPKIDAGSSKTSEKVNELLRMIGNEWPNCAIRSVYFEKVLSMCREYNLSQDQQQGKKILGKTKATTKAKSSQVPAASSASKIEEVGKLSASLLGACLDIFNILAEETPSNLFLRDNSSLLSEILASCFFMCAKAEVGELRRKLKQFATQILSTRSSKSSCVGPSVVLKVNVMLEMILSESEKEYRTNSRSKTAQSENMRQKPRTASVDEGDSTFEGAAVFGLEILKDATLETAVSSHPLSSTLLALLSSIVKQHITTVSSVQKQAGGTQLPQAGGTSIRLMYPTPTAGILSECLAESNQGVSRTAQPKDQFPSKSLQNFDQSLQAAVIILEILGRSEMVYTFSSLRKSFLQSLSNILDSSNNLQLLMSAVRIVSRWISRGFGGPLTVKERNSFLWKIASFDFNGLPDTISQPLVDLVSQYVLSLLGDGHESSTDIDRRPAASHKLADNDDVLIGRCLVACLLTANTSLRRTLLATFTSRSGGASKFVPESPGDKQLNVFAGSPVSVLWQLLHSDFEGLGGRNWATVFVELLCSSFRTVSPHQRRTSTFSEGGAYLGDVHPSDPHYDFFVKEMTEANNDLASGGFMLQTSLAQLAHVDIEFARGLFQLLLPKAWESIASDTVRYRMITPIESLLSRSFHAQFFKTGLVNGCNRPINVIKVFLETLALLKPVPVLEPDLLLSLAESYNCWFEVLSIMEDQFLVLSTKLLSKTGKAFHDKILLAIRHCYVQLGESNIASSLALWSCKLPDTHRAASFAVHGEIDKAVEMYTGLIDTVGTRGETDNSDFELHFIEESWIALQRVQCQAALVADYANSVKNPSLMLESAWKLKQWEHVRSLCGSPGLVAAVEAGDASVKICETLLAVADGKLGEVENLHAQTAQLCLYKWQLLPVLSHASDAHAALLHFFHRLVEIRESGQIMVETKNHSNAKTLPDLKNLLNAWRYRLPNDYEDLGMWDEIFTWRSHMFSAITSNFSWSEPSALASLHDRPWTSIRMARTARKQGMRQTSMLLLNRITDARSMNVSDAYQKLREQVLAYNNPESEVERTGGLNLINTTNLSFFDTSQMSELFRLKAIFLSSLRRTSKSNQAYCHSVQICPAHAKAWISWGSLCSSLGTLTEKSAEQAASRGGSTPESMKDAKAAAAKKVSQYLAQAMGCYLEAVQIETTEKARNHLPKCLWMLTKDLSPTSGLLCQTLESKGAKLPAWVWLPWIPQLLTGLCRAEGRSIKTLLAGVVKAYPQAVYYSLRAFYLERRDVERTKGVPSSSSQHMPSVTFAEEMMSTLRRSHASLWSSLEAILEELIVKFRPSYEEELLATISALLERAEAHAEKQTMPHEAKMEDEDAMVASWSKTLSRIAAKFFRATEASVPESRRDERVKKTTEFRRKYKDDFENDFKVDSSETQSSPEPADVKPKFKLSEYITRLQKWKTKLEEQVACTPERLPLIESSHSLAMFSSEPPDLWPGACDTKYTNTVEDIANSEEEDPSRNQSSTSSSAAIARKAAMNAAIAAANAAASEGVGGEYGGGSSVIEIPGQYCPNSAMTADVKPCPELHTKIIRFEPHVEVLRRNGQLVRRVGLVGNDGRVYRFLLQFAIPYWTRTDERTAQTNFVMDKFLRHNFITARNHLSVQPSAAIPVAQRLRMSLDYNSRVSLEDVLRGSLDRDGKELEALPAYFLSEVDRRLKSQATDETSQKDKETMEKEIRNEVYDEICQSKVDTRFLLRFIHDRLDGPENLFHFRRAFSGQLASNSLLQYIFSVAERTPPRFVMLMNKALLLSPDFRVSYSSQGFIEAQDMPFRMTPSIEALVGKPYIAGRFIRSIAMIAGAIREHREELDPILRLLMRDDILAWYSKSLAKSDSKTQELERQLIERVSKNVSLLHARFSECAPTSTKASKEGAIDSKIKDLYEQATKPENLSSMPANYHAWL